MLEWPLSVLFFDNSVSEMKLFFKSFAKTFHQITRVILVSAIAAIFNFNQLTFSPTLGYAIFPKREHKDIIRTVFCAHWIPFVSSNRVRALKGGQSTVIETLSH